MLIWRGRFRCLALVGMLASVQSALAVPVVFEANQNNLHARARFETSGSNLIVTLTNFSPVDVLGTPDVLTALFFDIAGSPTLTPSSVVVGPGSTVLFGTTDPGG